MIKIEGSQGGGQVLRSALSLSVITQQPFRMVDIRGQRGEGGLKYQHRAVVKAMQELCNAEVKGAELKSREIEFVPKRIVKDRVDVDIGTAGSATLVLQTIIPVLFHEQKSMVVRVRGGTDTSHCPPSMYFLHIYGWMLRRIGAEFSCDIKRFGFFPKGGGEIEVVFDRAHPLKKIVFRERGVLGKVDVHAVAARQLQSRRVAERMIEGFRSHMPSGVKVKDHVWYGDALNPGGVLHAHVHYDNYKVGESVLCEPGRKSEDVGGECAEKVKRLMKGDGVDKYLGDQVMVYMGLCGSGDVRVSEVTDHMRTNAQVIERFLPVRFRISDTRVVCKKRRNEG